MAVPSPATGLSTTAYRNKIEIRWVQNPDTVKGYNVYNTTTSGGGESGYVKLNTTLIEQYSEVRREVVSTQETITESGSMRTTVTEETLEDVYVFLYTHDNLTEETRQYYVVTAVTEAGEESPYSIEVDNTPLVISTELVTEPLRTDADISLDYIATLLEREPKLDVKPGSVTRQLHIDPNSREIAYVYVRRDFISRSQSFLSLNAIEDADDDRISDDVSTSSYKTLLKEAYFLTEDSDVQELIDAAYDREAANAGTFRQSAVKARGEVTFYTEVAPTVDVSVNAGEEVSTVPTETTSAVVSLAEKGE